ncbi:MAG: hypothetical protein V4617_00035 [Gemmatimonadota bacterium]
MRDTLGRLHHRTRLLGAVRSGAVLLLTLSMGALEACGAGGAGYGGAYGAGGGFGRRDERQFIGSFADVRAMGISRRYVFSGTPSGIAIYDRLLSAWLPPFTRDLGFGDDRITALAGDPVEDALWYGVPGAVVIYRPATEQVQRTIISGVPDAIVFERGGTGTGDALVRASGAWTRVSRVGITTPLMGPPAPSSVVVPATIGDVYERFPGLRAGAGLLLRDGESGQRADRALRDFAVTAGTILPERASEVWLGTNGDGMYRVDPTFQQATALRFGPIESGIGALALAADGVWAASLGTSALRGGLSFARDDLQRWRWIDGTISVPMIGVRANAMSIRAERAWIATDRGVVRARLDASSELFAWTALSGLPDDRVFAVAARDDGAWVGTARGLVWVSDSARNTRTRGIGTRLLDNVPVYALRFMGDTLWAGTASGLVTVFPTSDVAEGMRVGDTMTRDPALRGAVRALAWNDTVMLAATDDAVVAISTRGTRRFSRMAGLDPRQTGAGARLAVDDRTIVLTGADGVVVYTRATSAPRLLRVPLDIPAPVLDVAMSRDWIWLATPLGIARFRRSSDGGVP